MPEAFVVGSGPNGLAAAIVLARAGVSVHLVEAAQTLGGGMRSEELTLPGYVHDTCAALHPLALASPFLRTLPLERFGLEWLHSPAPLAHPLAGGRALLLHRSLALTADALQVDGRQYARLIGSFVASSDALLEDLLAPPHFPRHAALYARSRRSRRSRPCRPHGSRASPSRPNPPARCSPVSPLTRRCR